MNIIVELRLNWYVLTAIKQTEKIVLLWLSVWFSWLDMSLDTAIRVIFWLLIVDGSIERASFALIGVRLFRFHIIMIINID